jgi:hypothetical protein
MSLRPRPVLLALTTALACAAQAQDWRPASAFAQIGGGASDSNVTAASVGALWPWAWKAQALGGEFSALTELYGSYWHARDFGGGHRGFVQLGLVPLLRYRLDQGRSPWFVEGGIGASVTHRRYVTPDKTFSTNWNFSDNLAVGRSLGADRQGELSLRWQHISNAGIRKPNPGEDFLFVRYARSF